MSKRLPVIAQTIVYRKDGGNFEVLLLKRTEARGSFWNVVNGTLECDESIVECRARELSEEAGIKDVLRWSDEINRFSFQYHESPFVVVVYAAEVPADQSVVLNEEHTEYRWVGFDEALQMMKFDDDKNGLQACQEMLAHQKGENA
ncbi:MAG: NUDIX domain-containing protein [Candidatus Moraniibacteriota bacterium]